MKLTKCLAQENPLYVVHYFLLLLLLVYVPKYKISAPTLRELAHKNLEETLVANQWVFLNHTLRTTG